MQEMQINAPPRALPPPPGMSELPPLSYEPEAIARRLQEREPYNADHYGKAIAAIEDAREHKLDTVVEKWREFLREREREHNRTALEAFQAALRRVAGEAPPAAPRSMMTVRTYKTARPRAARRHHSTTRTTVAAASAASGESSPSADGSSRSGSASPSPTDDPPPPGRIRLAHTWHIAGISTAPAGSVVSFKAVAA